MKYVCVCCITCYDDIDWEFINNVVYAYSTEVTCREKSQVCNFTTPASTREFIMSPRSYTVSNFICILVCICLTGMCTESGECSYSRSVIYNA